MKATIVMFVIVLFFGCTKEQPAIYNNQIVKPTFSIGVAENLVVELHSPITNWTRYLDTLVTSDTFKIFTTDGNTAGYPTIIFDAISTNRPTDRIYPVTSYSWKIGNEPNRRNGKRVAVDFPNPIGTISINLIVTYNVNGSFISDTMYNSLTIIKTEVVSGTFIGTTSTNGVQQNSSLQIGLFTRPNGFKYYGIRNILNGFPVDINVIPRSNLFGFDISFYTTQSQFSYNNWVTSLPKGIGYFKGDSLYIDFGYFVFPALGDYGNFRTEMAQFKGKKQ